MNNSTKSLIFDFFQVGSILFILLTGSWTANSSGLIIIQLFAFIILIAGVWEMRRTKFYRVPDIGRQNELVKTGIFKSVRNPMYLAQLMFFGALVLNDLSSIRLFVYFIFLVNFILKINYEEKLLAKNFKEFAVYKKSSFRLIPFIF